MAHVNGDLSCQQIVESLSALAEPIRLRLVRMLLREELCVCELEDVLDMPQYAVSRHLAALRRAGLVETERVGRWIYYRIPRAVGPQGRYREMLVVIAEQVDGTVEGARDDKRLAERVALRRYGRCVVGRSVANSPAIPAPPSRVARQVVEKGSTRGPRFP
jgi:ArsR family transcriptional regulator